MVAIAEAVSALEAPDSAARAYLDYHRRRYEFLLAAAQRILAGQRTIGGRAPRILDVGPAYQTLLLLTMFPQAEVETLGFFDHRFPGLNALPHSEYDLNRAGEPDSWPQRAPFDLIVCAEVIEHLHIAPGKVFRMLRALLRPGGTLLLQTPNPVHLKRRLLMLIGHSPFEIIREDAANPGHFCEYTLADLKAIGAAARMDVTGWWLCNYFGPATNGIYEWACRMLPGQLAEGITVTFRRPFIKDTPG